MGEHKRALYDFSAAIHAETNFPQSENIVRDNLHPFDNEKDRFAMNYNLCGMCNHELAQYEEALAHYNIAHKIFKAVRNMNGMQEGLAGEILFNRGQTYSALGGVDNFLLAIKDFETAYK